MYLSSKSSSSGVTAIFKPLKVPGPGGKYKIRSRKIKSIVVPFFINYFKASLPYRSLNAYQPRAEYEFGSQVIKLIVVPIIVQHLFLTRVLLQVFARRLRWAIV